MKINEILTEASTFDEILTQVERMLNLVGQRLDHNDYSENELRQVHALLIKVAKVRTGAGL